jgi:hypothetical protein
MSNLFNVSSIPLHVNQYFYQMSSLDSYLVVETLSTIGLPANPAESRAVMILNVSDQQINIDSTDGTNKIYNNLYAPVGSFSLTVDANRIIYLIYAKNLLTNQGRWLTHLG